MRRRAALVTNGLAWLLLAAGLAIIALNPAVPSLNYALIWGGVIVATRGVGLLAPWLGAAIAIPLLLVCFLGLEIGGLIVAPSVLLFLTTDLLQPSRR